VREGSSTQGTILHSSRFTPLFVVYSSSIHPLLILYSSSTHPLFVLYSSTLGTGELDLGKTTGEGEGVEKGLQHRMTPSMHPDSPPIRPYSSSTRPLYRRLLILYSSSTHPLLILDTSSTHPLRILCSSSIHPRFILDSSCIRPLCEQGIRLGENEEKVEE
jgi:hypothetical protein